MIDLGIQAKHYIMKQLFWISIFFLFSFSLVAQQGHRPIKVEEVPKNILAKQKKDYEQIPVKQWFTWTVEEKEYVGAMFYQNRKTKRVFYNKKAKVAFTNISSSARRLSPELKDLINSNYSGMRLMSAEKIKIFATGQVFYKLTLYEDRATRFRYHSEDLTKMDAKDVPKAFRQTRLYK